MGHTSSHVGSFVSTLDAAEVPSTVVEYAKLLVLDTLGCAIAGTTVEPRMSMLRRVELRGAGPGRSQLLASGECVDAATAAAYNAEAGGVLSAQESLYFSHTANLSLATALAVCQQEKSGGAELLSSFVAGFETTAVLHLMRDIGLPATTAPTGYQSSHNEFMTVGAAAAAARALGLDASRTAHALEIAAATSPRDGGNVAPLADLNYCDYATKGRAAVRAAMLAAEGFTGRPGTIEESLLRTAAGEPRQWVLDELGSTWWTEQTSVKHYPGCRFISGPIDDLKRIVEEHRLSADEIESIEVRVSAHALANPKIGRDVEPAPDDPSAPLNLVFSAPYHAALVVLGVEEGPRWYAEETRRRPDLEPLMRKVSVVEDPTMSQRLVDHAVAQRYRRIEMSAGAGVTVRARGRVFAAECDYVRGDPFIPRLRASYADVVAKAHRYCDDIIGVSAVAELAELVTTLEELPDLHRLTDLAMAVRATT